MRNLFVVVLRYVVAGEQVDVHRPAHVEFLEKHYKNKTFFVSGAQTPRTGGIIFAQSDSRTTLEKILHQDPFYTQGLAEYQIFEFSAVRLLPEFKEFLEKVQ